MKPEDQYLSLKSLSAYSDTPVPTLRDYMKHERLPHFKVRGKILVKLSEFDAWMKTFRGDSDRLDNIVSDVMNNLSSDR